MKNFFFTFVVLAIAHCPFLYSQDLNSRQEGTVTPQEVQLKNISNDSTGLIEIYNSCAAGLNYVQTSWKVTTRYGSGSSMPANFILNGIPSAATVVRAFAWWVVSYQSGSATNPEISITTPSANTLNYTALIRGQNINKCWGEIGTRTFRADITSAISGNGTYLCDILGNTVWEIDGVTILVVYVDSTVSKRGRIIINDGCLTYGNTQPDTVTTDVISNFNACFNSDYANAFTISSDQQDNIIPPAHQCIFNGDTVSYPNLFWNFDTDTTHVDGGQSAFGISIMPNIEDCWTWAVSGLYYQTDSCELCFLQSVADNLNKQENFLSIYPNPAATHLFVERNKFSSSAVLELLDCFGRSVQEEHLSPGTERLEMDVSHLSAGLYFARLTDEKNSIMKKLLIER